MKSRVHHFSAEKAAAYFAKGAHPFALGERRLMTGVEAEEAQGDFAGAVRRFDDHLPARAILDFAGLNDHFNLHRLAPRGVDHASDLRFVLVTKRQMDQ